MRTSRFVFRWPNRLRATRTLRFLLAEFNSSCPKILASLGGWGFVWSVLLSACVPAASPSGSAPSQTSTEYYSDKVLRTDDHVYLDQVQTVQLYAETDHATEVLEPPVIPISQQFPLILEFDLLQDEAIRCQVRILNCNADWTVSDLVDMQFVNEYNQFYINELTASNSTRINFWHYRFQVPQVKLSGNYVLVVTGPGGNTDYLLTRRFQVYEERVNILAQVNFGAGPGRRFTHQQVDFKVTYPGLPLVNPAQTVKVLVRQNHRWDNAKTDLTPTFIREDQKLLDYVFFNGENAFPGLNEYRAFDTRSVRSIGLNIMSMNIQKPIRELVLIPEKPRTRDVYSQMPDVNGQFVIGNREYGSGAETGDYNHIVFTLRSPLLTQPVYVFGSLSDWKLDKRFLMEYNDSLQAYQATVLLKQGYYNYHFAQKAPGSPLADEASLEGSFNMTENRYEVMVYYRAPGQRSDRLVGYFRTDYFGR